MQKASDWDATRAAIGGEGFEQMTPGGHVVKILNATVGEYNGHEQLILSFDIDEGSDLDGFYRRQFEAIKKRSDGARLPQWPVNGTFKQFTRDYNNGTKTNPFFKGLIQAITDSNPRYAWDWNERSLTGKYVGMIFREEEYLNRDGEIKTTVRAFACCNAAEAANKDIPRKKEYGGPRTQAGGGGFTETNDDDLPF